MCVRVNKISVCFFLKFGIVFILSVLFKKKRFCLHELNYCLNCTILSRPRPFIYAIVTNILIYFCIDHVTVKQLTFCYSFSLCHSPQIEKQNLQNPTSHWNAWNLSFPLDAKQKCWNDHEKIIINLFGCLTTLKIFFHQQFYCFQAQWKKKSEKC